MESRVTVNKEVNITAWSFRRRHQQLQSFPKRMEFDNHEYNFAEGLRYLVQRGRQAIQLFDMSDGQNKYRLKLGEDQVWTLVSITSGRPL